MVAIFVVVVVIVAIAGGVFLFVGRTVRGEEFYGEYPLKK